MQANQIKQIDITKYPETCPDCQRPARSELINEGYPNENDLYFFCINPKCINFDGAHIRQQREVLEKLVRQSPTFKRYQKRLWQTEIRRHAHAKQELRNIIKRLEAA